MPGQRFITRLSFLGGHTYGGIGQRSRVARMRLLVLGGTSFVGRAIVAEVLRRGAMVTLFSRGRTGSDLFPQAERCRGDRDAGDYASLARGSWDTVVDVSGYVPRHVQQAAEAVNGRADRYLFISTGSVYDVGRAPEVISEDAPRLAPVRDTEQVDGDTYGGLKVACEDDVLARWGDAATIVRPGIVAGPYDPTDRFTWWVRRAAQGGRVPLAGRPEQPVQVVDAGDLARLVAAVVAGGVPGVFNAVGPAEPTTLGGLIETCARAAGAQVEVVAVPQDAVDPPLPLVLPGPTWDVMFRRDASRARGAGLTATPLMDTAAAVLAWDRGRGEPPLAVGLSPEREKALLEKG